MPFKNLSGDPGQEYFSDGFTEEMILQLGRLVRGRIGVLSRTSSQAFKGSGRRAREIRVRRREVRIRRAGLLEIRDRLREALVALQVPVVATLQIGLIRRRIV